MGSICSHCSLQKSNHEWITSFALYKKVTESELIPSIFALLIFCSLLSSIFKKERPWANNCHGSLQKDDCEWIAVDFIKKERFARKNILFVCFWKFFTVFPPFYVKRVNRFSLSCSFLKIDGINLLSWANHSLCSLQKSDCERIDNFKKEQREQFALFHKCIALWFFWSQKKGFAKK